jgi:multiple sugar transport system substrate-binding protein
MQTRRSLLSKLFGAGVALSAIDLLTACSAPPSASAPTSAPPAAAPTAAAAAPTTAPAVAPKPTTAVATAAAQAAPTTQAASSGTLPVGAGRFTKKYQGTQLNVLMADRPTTNILKDKYLSVFKDMTGISVTFDTPPYDPQHQKAMVDLSNASSSYDVMMMDCPWLAEFVNTKNIMRLDDLVKQEDPSFIGDLIPRIVEAMGRGLDGGLYAIPNVGVAVLLNYRKDIFEQEASNYQAATGNQLKPADTWPEFRDQAKYFTKQVNAKSPTDYGAPLNGNPSNGALNMIQVILWGMGGREVNTNYQATINDDKAMPAWELLAELGKYAQPDAGASNWDPMNTVYKTGSAVMQFQASEFVAVNEADDSPIKGKTGYAWIPGHAPQTAGWAVVINKNSKNPEASWDFIRWMTGPEFAKDLQMAGGAPPRTSIMTDPGIVKQFPFLPYALDEFKAIQNRLSACPTCPGLIPEAQYELQVGTEASAVITGAKSPKDGADASEQIVDKLMKDFGYLKA